MTPQEISDFVLLIVGPDVFMRLRGQPFEKLPLYGVEDLSAQREDYDNFNQCSAGTYQLEPYRISEKNLRDKLIVAGLDPNIY